MPRHARLAEHKHTAKLLPHHHTHYHGLLVVVALALACTFLIQIRTQALDLQVTATVPAPIPAEAPTIDSPANGTVSEQPSVTISGSCPVVSPAVIIIIYEGGNSLGSQPCNPQGGYSFPVELTVGSHILKATVMTITGDYGASSSLVEVSYQRPLTTGASGTASAQAGGGNSGYSDDGETAALKITPMQLFIAYWRTRDAIWNGTFTGGKAPYSATIAWGDGSVEKLKGLRSGDQQLRHRYDKIDNYTVRIELFDANGASTFAHIAAMTGIVRYRPFYADQPFAGGLTGESIAIRLYLTMLLLIVILWIYETKYKLRSAGTSVT